MGQYNVFEIVGTGIHNQGAELMAYAISEQISLEMRGVCLVDPEFGVLLDRVRCGLFGKFEPVTIGRAWLARKALTSFLRHRFGIFSGQDTDVVLDASGFCYTSDWKTVDTVGLLERRMAAADKIGAKYIFMPQAFGPFDADYDVEKLRNLLIKAHLIFVRDKVSQKYLVELLGSNPKLHLAPDFTSLVSPAWTPKCQLTRGAVTIVPNNRMLDKTSPEIAENYLRSLETVCRHLTQRNVKFCFLAHSFEDNALIDAVAQSLGRDVVVITESDPRRLKAILASSRLVLGSRFHALQSALSCGVPCVGIGWSHKYNELFEQFGFPEGNLPAHLAPEQLLTMIDHLLVENNQHLIKSTLLQSAEAQKYLVEKMWNTLFESL